MSNLNDPYQLLPEEVIEPLKTFLDTLKRIGPGMILAADGDPGGADLQLHRPRSYGSDRRNPASDDAARHRYRRGLSASPPVAEGDPAFAMGDHRAVGGHRIDRVADGLFSD